MNTETKMAYRATVSEVLLYMCEEGRSQSEILSVLDRLELITVDLVNLEVLAAYPAAEPQQLKPADRILFRSQIAAILEVVSRPDTLPPKIQQMMQDLEKWIEEQGEERLRIIAAGFGKPKMTVTRLPN